MPSDISVIRAGLPPAVDPPAARAAAQPPPEPPPAAPGARPMPNPSLRLDAGLELVVIEFRDGSGEVRDTIPSRAQLEAYRSWDRMQAGDPPVGMPGAAARADAPPPAPEVVRTASVPVPGEGPAIGVVPQAGGATAPVVSAPGPAPAPAAPPAPGPAPPVPDLPVGQFKLPSTFAD